MGEATVKLNKETLEASLTQIEYLKSLKKDQINGLCKMFDGRITSEDLEEFEKLFRSYDTEEVNQMPVSQLGTVLRILQQVPTENEINKLIETVNPKKADSGEKKAEKSRKKAGQKVRW